jgi:hypothetical protein
MTMHNTPHPDDERLAAYAGGDRDALDDRSLVSHVAACDRCRPLVDELSFLVGSLAELPDLAPSRPLRLIPPVRETALPAAGPRGWLRRLTAPAMAAGAALFLVGAVGIGSTGFAGLASKSAGYATDQEAASASDRELGPAAGGEVPSVAPDDTRGSTDFESSALPATMGSGQPGTPTAATPAPRTPQPSVGDGGRNNHEAGGSSSEQPWLTLLIAGVGLFAISTALRFSLAPRAG